MRVMVIIKADKNSEAGKMPSEQVIAEMMRFNEELVNAGILLAADGLHPSSKGKRVKYFGGETTVTDGPFAMTRELIAGYWLWRVKSLEQAVEWVKRIPNPEQDDWEVEIRQVGDIEDFGELATPELRAQEASMREKIKAKQT